MRLTVTKSPLPAFEHDVNVSPATKSEVFKFLSVILKNLLKSDDAKYRQLKTSNAKIQRLISHSAVSVFLMQSVGFEAVPSESLLRITNEPNSAQVEAMLKEVSSVQDRVSSLLPPPAMPISNSSSASSLPEVLSEKQKARKMREEKEAADKEEARVARKRTVSQIKADKHVRENDPNWKPTVSAAAAKAGDAMTTFRDKFGEN